MRNSIPIYDTQGVALSASQRTRPIEIIDGLRRRRKPERNRLQRCIATINRWTDYCNNREIIVSDYWLSQKHRKIIGPDGLEK